MDALAKRACDLLVALAGLVFSLPLALAAAVAILLDTGWPVLYRQVRVGRGGALFAGLKFRSMRADAERGRGPVQAVVNDTRVTRVGRVLRDSALDELPQLLNILNGDMSVVGPRALRPVEIEAADGRPRHLRDYPGFEERCRVRPGLTGVSQLLLPRDASRTEKFRYDTWYVRHRTLGLDFALLAVSVLVTLRARWESHAGKPSLEALRRRTRADLGPD
jgi:lipopolysaccharide/colanic/teichoic acid biosynthesis glycosyltransferase